MITITSLRERRISWFVDNYSLGTLVPWAKLREELLELAQGIMNLDWANTKEEFADVVHILQVVLFWRYGWNGKLWRLGLPAVRKFIARQGMWRQMYQILGLPQSTRSCGKNYKKLTKAIELLGGFGISPEDATRAWATVTGCAAKTTAVSQTVISFRSKTTIGGYYRLWRRQDNDAM